MGKLRAPYNFVPLNQKVIFPEWAEQISQDVPSSNIKYIDNQLVTVIKIQMICKCKYKTI